MADEVAIEARWELSNAGFSHPHRERLIALAFRVAALVAPGFDPSHEKQKISDTWDAEEYGGTFSTDTYRMGDAERGVEVVETVFDPSDGIAPFSAGATITAYGLPEGCALTLEGSFYAPMTERPNPARLPAPRCPRLPWPRSGICCGGSSARHQ